MKVILFVILRGRLEIGLFCYYIVDCFRDSCVVLGWSD